MKPERLEKFDKKKLIEFILRKDEEIENLNNRTKNIEYIGTLFIKGKHYSFLIRDDER